MADAAPKAPGASDGLASPPPPKVSSKDAYKYVPVLEEFLVVAFVLEMLWCVWTFWSMDSILLELCVMLVVVAVVLEVVKRIISWIGTQLSVFVHYCGMVDTSRPHPLKGRRQMKKWREQSWQLFVHGFMAMVEIFILYRSAPRNWDELVEWPWVDFPHQEQDPLLIHLYIAQLAVWTYTAVVCVWVDERRKDYQVMLAHHVVTIGLVSGSLSAGLLRIGLLVLYVNDTSDVFVDLLKMTNYLKLESRRGWFGSEIAFINMMLAWLYWRLYEFPTYVLQSSIITGRRRWDLIADRQHWTDYFDQAFPLYWQMNSLLLVLLGLYFWWFYLMARILVKMATGSVRQASREEYEGDSEDEAGHDAGTSLMVDAINRSADTRAPVASAAGFSSPTTEPIVAGGSPAKGKAKGAKQQ